MMATTLRNSVFPVAGVVAVNACIGAVAIERRSIAVRIAEIATLRCTSSTNGNVLISSLITRSASKASARPGFSGIAGNSHDVLRSTALIGSYPGLVHIDPSRRRNGAVAIANNGGTRHAPSRPFRYVSMTFCGGSVSLSFFVRPSNRTNSAMLARQSKDTRASPPAPSRQRFCAGPVHRNRSARA